MNRYDSWAENGFPEPVLRMYTFRSHCALVGRFQNAEAEVNLPACRELDIDVNRRLTGGGTVLMGEGQLMISISSSTEHPIVPSHPARMLSRMAGGIIAGLAELGIKAEYRPKNDIVVEGKKIVGTAISIEETGAFQYQASILMDFDVALMLKTLRIPPEKLSDKEVHSFEDRLTTVSREIGRPVDLQEVAEAVHKGYERTLRISTVHAPFSDDEIREIERIERERYLTDEWIFHRQPAPDMLGQAVRKTPAGLVRVYVALFGDQIKSALITGDFFSGNRVVNDIEASLKWGKAGREAILRAIKAAAADSGDSIQGISADELASIVHEAVENSRMIRRDYFGRNLYT